MVVERNNRNFGEGGQEWGEEIALGGVAHHNEFRFVIHAQRGGVAVNVFNAGNVGELWIKLLGREDVYLFTHCLECVKKAKTRPNGVAINAFVGYEENVLGRFQKMVRFRVFGGHTNG